MNYLATYGPPWVLLVLSIAGIGFVIDTALTHNRWFVAALVPFIVLAAAATAMLFW